MTPQEILAAMLKEQAERKKGSIEVMKSKRKTAVQPAVSQVAGGGLSYNGQHFDEGDLVGRSRQEATVSMDGLPGELTRGQAAVRPERSVDNLEFDPKKKQWFRMVRGEKIYE